MKALELYKFIKDKGLEYHWHHDLKTEYPDDVILFVDDYAIKDFMWLLASGKMKDDGFPCQMKDGYFCFWMAEICDYFDVDINEVFSGVIWDHDEE